ncbi:MAG: hypothetical protein C0391_03935 [Anaerolinea sp.]|nr:hypothetical protein [Anaerolinea sp.]
MPSANLIDIIMRAIDHASPDIKKVAGESDKLGSSASKLNEVFKSATGISLGSASAYAIAGLAIKKATDFVIVATEKTQAYNLTIIDNARLMGADVEEASRLYQIGDDVRVSQETLTQAMKFANEQGIQPNIASLVRLANEYVALIDPVEKNQFAVDMFGRRAGPEMQKLLELGGQAILNYAANVEDSLIVTEEAAAATKLYYQNTDILNDRWTSFSHNVGNVFIPALNDLLEAVNGTAPSLTDMMNDVAEQQYQNALAIVNKYEGITPKGGYSQYLLQQSQQIVAAWDELNGYTPIPESWANDFKDVGRATGDAVPPTERLAKATSGLATEAQQAALALQNELENLNKLANINPSIGSQFGSDIEKLKWEAAGGIDIQRIGKLIENGVDAGTVGNTIGQQLFSQLAVQSAIAAGKVSNDWKKAGEQLSNDLGIPLKDANKLLENAKKNGDSITDIEQAYNITVYVHYVTSGGIGIPGNITLPYGGAGGNQGTPTTATPQASGTGGYKTVPPGYSNDTYYVPMKSGEEYDVKNANDPKKGGGDTIINVYNYGRQEFIARNEQSLSSMMKEMGQL